MQAHPCVEARAYCTPLLSLSGPILNCLSPPHGFYSIRSMVNPTCHTCRWPVACPSASLPSLTFTQSDNKATFACHTRILESPPSTFCLNFLLIRIPAAIRSPGQTWYILELRCAAFLPSHCLMTRPPVRLRYGRAKAWSDQTPLYGASTAPRK